MPQILERCREAPKYPWSQDSEIRAGDYAYARARSKPPKRGRRLERGYEIARHFVQAIAARRRDEPGTLKKEFREHAERWYQETRILSSIPAILFNQNYQRIIGMGRAVLPF